MESQSSAKLTKPGKIPADVVIRSKQAFVKIKFQKSQLS